MTDGVVGSRRSGIFARSVGVLVGGTVSAHAITALALPVLTRLYTPEEFSRLAVFTGLTSIIAVVASLRFDIAVPIPDTDADAANLLALALGSVTAVTLAVGVPALLAPDLLASAMNQPANRSHLALLPVGVLLTASFAAFQSWFVRTGQFGVIARSRFAQSAVGASCQVGLGLLGAGSIGLVAGYLANACVACGVLGSRLVRERRGVLSSIHRSKMRAMFWAYHRFPKYSTLEALSNTAAIQVPVLIIAARAARSEAGYLSLAMNLMQAPMAVVGVAVGQVFLSQAPHEHREGTLGSFTSETLGRLLKLGIGPLAFVGIVAPGAFSLVFGSEWRRAGVLVAWMTPWFMMQFLSSPISMALHVVGKQRAALILQVAALVTRVSVVLVAAQVLAEGLAEAYALSGFAIYFAYSAVILRAVAAPWADIKIAVRRSMPYVLGWVAGGIVAAWAVGQVAMRAGR